MERKSAYNKRWPRKNLGELLNFIEERHGTDQLSLQELSEDLEMTRGGASSAFRKDDMKLSKVQQIARKYGYRLDLYFPVRTYSDGYVAPKPRRQYPNAGVLTGLVKYIQDSGYSIQFVAEKMNVSPQCIHRAFNNGDISISLLNDFVDALGICVIWKFEKESQENS